MNSRINRITSRASLLLERYHWWLAGALLLLMGGLAFGSMAGNSAIVDEVAHIPAGYSYLKFGDYRLNPEHPPLIKDLAGIPLQFMDLKFPEEIPAWTTDINGQWEAGWHFLYHIGNDADAILFWSRLPIVLLALVFGAVLYAISRRYWGTKVALLVLFFYALSPNIIAHSGFVTTDLGATVVLFLAIVAFARFIGRPTKASVAWLALALTVAQLTKFSAILLYAFLGVAALGFAWILRNPVGLRQRLKWFVGGFMAASALSLVGIWLFYATQVWRMPVAVQDALIRGSMVDDKIRFVAEALVAANHYPFMHPIVQYFLGVAMVFGRVTGGNVTYFNGQVASGSFHMYFPQLFVVKTQLALLILALAVLVFLLWRFLAGRQVRIVARLTDNIRAHVLEWTLGAFGLFYFLVSVAGNLNLGIRHILPVYIPVFILVAIGVVALVRQVAKSRWYPAVIGGLAGLLIWYGASTLVNYPHYVSYFNELIGGPSQSYKYFSDSSVDWGQDLKRLKEYVDAHPEIDKIAVDYFGGGVPAYYFCPRKYDEGGELIKDSTGYDCSDSVFTEWHAQNGAYPGQYIAVSETFLENDRYYADYYKQPGYDYLRAMEPIAKVGNSIFVFKLY